ncbi:e3 ubiquitin-protein ligase synoviolin b-like [Dermatophagoides farinae]|uniref:E3 ubiquitin-protein ligase synoviolin b-like n=1 Tax=Dermatophagoides farinae TaxID=6954 RepID=A0A9D4NUE8_DERFA|nr:E3 ubiquitin-protein ligase synoviolin A-like [Dermatophagoides farinae]KAH7638503.1 e3 ubiquitin-protein ligase synoviolin b-like [Dermatophagoides farinae]
MSSSSINNGLTLISSSIFIILARFTYAYYVQNQQFYPICVKIIQHPLFIMATYINMIMIVQLTFEFISKYLFGHLRSIELEYINDNRWPLFLELSSSFVLFQPLFKLINIIHFCFIFYFTILHLLLEKRLEQINQIDDDNIEPDHLRLIIIQSLSAIINFIQIWSIYYHQRFILFISTTTMKTNMLLTLLFLYRYIYTTCLLIRCIGDYIMNIIDRLYYQNEWQEKLLYRSFIQMITCAICAISQTLIWMAMISNGIRALSLLRYAIRKWDKFLDCCYNLYRSYCTINRMMTMFSIPTIDEISNQQPCPICLDIMLDREYTRKAINCRHIYHRDCLKRWIHVRQFCPVCRETL